MPDCHTMVRETPEGWNWGIGEKSDSYYDYWAYDENGDYEIHMLWDKGNNHMVEIIPVEGTDENGDRIYGYPKETCEFETEEKAEKYAISLMEKYS